MLSTEARERRARIMQRSMALGHCVCDHKKPCPCPRLKNENICECAGEAPQFSAREVGEIRLTDYVSSAGCASKISKKILMETLADLPEFKAGNVLRGSKEGDDAGVIAWEKEDDAAILTIDVFTPSVDDPYRFGQIAAANSVSDIYAMGGKPRAALSFIGFPVNKLPRKVMFDILRGGIDKLAEAGISVVGGHSIKDDEVKCGFAVLGGSRKEKFVKNAGARPGDVLVLTKKLGNGIISFANQIARAKPEWVEDIAESMATLNKAAAETAAGFDVHAMTDITGFSLLGHLYEIVKNSHIDVQVDFDRLPFFDGVQLLAVDDVFPGAAERNRESVPAEHLDFSTLSPAQEMTLFSPETSGGLLLLLPAEQAEAYCQAMRADNHMAVIIGTASACARALPCIGVSSVHAALWTTRPRTVPVVEKSPEPDSVERPAGGACCANPPGAPASGAVSNRRPVPAHMGEFSAFSGATMGKPGALDLKHKKLMALALSVGFKCQPCIDVNIAAAKENGATDAEIAEAVAMGVAFGGASALMAYNNPN